MNATGDLAHLPEREISTSSYRSHHTDSHEVVMYEDNEPVVFDLLNTSDSESDHDVSSLTPLSRFFSNDYAISQRPPSNKVEVYFDTRISGVDLSELELRCGLYGDLLDLYVVEVPKESVAVDSSAIVPTEGSSCTGRKDSVYTPTREHLLLLYKTVQDAYLAREVLDRTTLPVMNRAVRVFVYFGPRDSMFSPGSPILPSSISSVMFGEYDREGVIIRMQMDSVTGEFIRGKKVKANKIGRKKRLLDASLDDLDDEGRIIINFSLDPCKSCTWKPYDGSTDDIADLVSFYSDFRNSSFLKNRYLILGDFPEECFNPDDPMSIEQFLCRFTNRKSITSIEPYTMRGKPVAYVIMASAKKALEARVQIDAVAKSEFPDAKIVFAPPIHFSKKLWIGWSTPQGYTISSDRIKSILSQLVEELVTTTSKETLVVDKVTDEGELEHPSEQTDAEKLDLDTMKRKRSLLAESEPAEFWYVADKSCAFAAFSRTKYAVHVFKSLYGHPIEDGHFLNLDFAETTAEESWKNSGDRFRDQDEEDQKEYYPFRPSGGDVYLSKRRRRKYEDTGDYASRHSIYGHSYQSSHNSRYADSSIGRDDDASSKGDSALQEGSRDMDLYRMERESHRRERSFSGTTPSFKDEGTISRSTLHGPNHIREDELRISMMGVKKCYVTFTLSSGPIIPIGSLGAGSIDSNSEQNTLGINSNSGTISTNGLRSPTNKDKLYRPRLLDIRHLDIDKKVRVEHIISTSKKGRSWIYILSCGQRDSEGYDSLIDYFLAKDRVGYTTLQDTEDGTIDVFYFIPPTEKYNRLLNIHEGSPYMTLLHVSI